MPPTRLRQPSSRYTHAALSVMLKSFDLRAHPTHAHAPSPPPPLPHSLPHTPTLYAVYPKKENKWAKDVRAILKPIVGNNPELENYLGKAAEAIASEEDARAFLEQAIRKQEEAEKVRHTHTPPPLRAYTYFEAHACTLVSPRMNARVHVHMHKW
jgi:hypothetical protein